MKLVLTFIFATSAMFAQTPPGVAFEVASIKPAPPLDPKQVMAGKLHVGMQVDGARVDIGFLSLAELIPMAYRVKRYQVAGPDWLAQARFDIMGKIPEGATKDQVPDMLQALLAERFKLTVHHDTKEQSVYALVVGKKGSKLKEALPEDPATADAGAPTNRVQVGSDNKGFVVRGGQAGTTRMSMGQNGTMHFESSKMTMVMLCEMLSRFVDRPVVDMTDLKGEYQVGLDLSMEDMRNVARAAGAMVAGGAPELTRPPTEGASDPSGGSIFTAVQELGLKLESRKSAVDMIVIDHLEKVPTEN